MRPVNRIAGNEAAHDTGEIRAVSQRHSFHTESGISLFWIFFIQRDGTSDHGAYHRVNDLQHDLFLRRDSSVYQSAQSAYSWDIAALTAAIWGSTLTNQIADYANL